MKDDRLISLNAAIDALEELKIRYFDRKVIIGKTQDVINNMPSAQPEIIYCKDCKYFERDIQRSWGTYNGCGVWTDDGNEIEVNQDDFCSYAERREE